MKQDLTLNIGSKFNGEGLKKMDSALKGAASSAKTATNSVGAATRAIGAMGDAVGGLDGKIGKVAQGLQGLFGAFTQGGLIGAAIVGVTTVVTFCINKFKEMQEAGLNAAKAIGQGFQIALGGIQAQINNMLGGFNNVQNAIVKGNQFNQQMGNLNKQGQLNAINQRHAINQLGMNAEQLALDNKLKTAEIAQTNANSISSRHKENISTIDEQIDTEQKRMEFLNQEINRVNREMVVQRNKLQTLDYQNMSKEQIQTITDQYKTIGKKGTDEIKRLERERNQAAERLVDLQNKRNLTVRQSEVEGDAANLNAGRAWMEYGQAKVTDYARQGLEKANAWLNENVKPEEQTTSLKDKLKGVWQKTKDAVVPILKKGIEAQQKQILGEAKANAQKRLVDARQNGQNDIAELQRKLNERIEKDRRDTLLNLANPGRTSLGDIRNQRRQNEVDAAFARNRVKNIQNAAGQGIENVASRIFKSDGSIRKFSDTNLAQLDKSIKDARAAGVAEDEILRRIGGEQNIQALDQMRNSLAQKIADREARKGANDADVKRMKNQLGQLDRIKDAAIGKRNLQNQIQNREKKMAEDLGSIRKLIGNIDKAMKNVGL